MMENRYDRYKDSGIAWIGEIPEHWEVCSIKQIMKNKSIKGFPNETVLSLYRDLGVIPKDSREDNHNVTSEDTSNYKFVEEGDFVINKMKAWQGSMAISDYKGIVSPAYYVCKVINSKVDKKYIHYLLRNESYKVEYMRLSTGMRIGQWDLNINDFLQINTIIPSVLEQQSIATYLDQKCGEIDELITLQEKMITKLQSYKQSVITEAVTKGLDKNVPLKDSGIEWIGKIPEHWKITKVQYLAQLKSGYNLTTEEITDNGLYPVYGGNGIRGYYDKYFLEGDYVLIGRQGALCGNINYSTNKSWATEHAIVCYPKIKYVTRWFGELLRVMNLNQYSLAAAQPGLAVERIKLLPIPIIPLSEQQSIADYLNQKCSEIDELISIKQQKIEKLKEYKKSLIFECVTGKRKVS